MSEMLVFFWDNLSYIAFGFSLLALIFNIAVLVIIETGITRHE